MLIEPRTAADPDVAALTAAAVAELNHRYAADDAGRYPVDPAARFLVAVVAGAAVGCGAVQPLAAAGTAEIKRMYVRPAYRGRGVGRRLLAALEATALAAGWPTLRLETGVRQPEAIRLYESAGYRPIPPYGPYVGDPDSVCFERVLAGAGRPAVVHGE